MSIKMKYKIKPISTSCRKQMESGNYLVIESYENGGMFHLTVKKPNLTPITSWVLSADELRYLYEHLLLASGGGRLGEFNQLTTQSQPSDYYECSTFSGAKLTSLRRGRIEHSKKWFTYDECQAIIYALKEHVVEVEEPVKKITEAEKHHLIKLVSFFDVHQTAGLVTEKSGLSEIKCGYFHELINKLTS